MTVTIPKNIVFKKVGEETVLLDFELGVYYGLDPVGTRIFELFAESKSVDEVVAAIVEEYDAGEEQVRRDLDALLGELAGKGLVRLDG